MNRHHVSVAELPESLRSALKSTGYGGKDIAIEARETASVIDAGSDGRRGFVVLVDLATGRAETHMGSWGGANMFNTANAVDRDSTERAILPGMAVIKGSEGGTSGQVFAHICLHPSNIAKFLPVQSDLNARELKILGTFNLISSYRKVEQAEMKVTTTELDGLVGKGLITRNKAGACALTTAGKNAKPKY